MTTKMLMQLFTELLFEFSMPQISHSPKFENIYTFLNPVSIHYSLFFNNMTSNSIFKRYDNKSLCRATEYVVPNIVKS